MPVWSLVFPWYWVSFDWGGFGGLAGGSLFGSVSRWTDRLTEQQAAGGELQSLAWLGLGELSSSKKATAVSRYAIREEGHCLLVLFSFVAGSK